MTPQEELKNQEAQKRVQKMKSFYIHLIVFIIVNSYIVIKKTQHIDEGETIWHAFKVPFFWGIGLVMHGLKAFDSVPFIGKDWEERKIKEMMDKDNTNKK